MRLRQPCVARLFDPFDALGLVARYDVVDDEQSHVLLRHGMSRIRSLLHPVRSDLLVGKLFSVSQFLEVVVADLLLLVEPFRPDLVEIACAEVVLRLHVASCGQRL